VAYGVAFKPEADADLARVASADPVAASIVLDAIDRLATDPVNLSRKPSFPHRPFQKYQFWAADLFVTVLFSYGPDEQSLIIEGIGFVARPR
jgi:hypothetical protein